VTRMGFDSDVTLRIANVPAGITVEGGFVVGGAPVKESPRSRSGRGVLVLTAASDAKFAPMELHVEGVAKMPDGSEIVREAEGPGMLVGVTGATLQGSVDRQRPITAPWLGLTLPSALTKAP